ncbi:helix-turn-helix transcriptional regulator [Pediococcus pentosaceus]|uniref:helix-turn-helix domain-containing protein n=1 Tax=Pediococcus pentosaceus TaxID=1255 RepID=UPI0018A16C20|nr:helix-turn-helix transcriptional regulator [Pediococcus pentosaceus]MBF7139095.1 helix-turn-helix transcriptional regulator [Pediococcus pentosaceus]MCM6820603.1 helix-turn-helix transcriptional regulator [Pediococcus pentosaceus]
MKTIINNEVLIAIKRKRGELNMTISKLAVETGVSRFTIYRIFEESNVPVYPSTKEKLITWLAKNS